MKDEDSEEAQPANSETDDAPETKEQHKVWKPKQIEDENEIVEREIEKPSDVVEENDEKRALEVVEVEPEQKQDQDQPHEMPKKE